jgi:hypothetical protein
MDVYVLARSSRTGARVRHMPHVRRSGRSVVVPLYLFFLRIKALYKNQIVLQSLSRVLTRKPGL